MLKSLRGFEHSEAFVFWLSYLNQYFLFLQVVHLLNGWLTFSMIYLGFRLNYFRFQPYWIIFNMIHLLISYELIAWFFYLFLRAFFTCFLFDLAVTFLMILMYLLAARCTLCLRMTSTRYQQFLGICLNRWNKVTGVLCFQSLIRLRTSCLDSTSELQWFSLLDKASLSFLFFLLLILFIFSPWVPVYMRLLNAQLLSIRNI